LPLILILFLLLAPPASAGPATPVPALVPNLASAPQASRLLLVGFREEAAATVRHAIRGEFRAELVRRRSGYELWSLPEEYTPASAAVALWDSGSVAWACPVSRLRAHLAPNDPFFTRTASTTPPCGPDQWGAFRIDLPRAWDFTQGSTDVLVALVDAGASHSHPQLSGRFWANRGERPGNQLDDDGNGYIDDVTGYDFAGRDTGGPGDDPLSEDPNPALDPEPGMGPDPSIGNGVRDAEGYSPFPPDAFAVHGTLVAGIIAANADDGRGYAGVDWYSRLMDLRAGNAEGTAFNMDVVDAIHYAVDNRADVIYLAYGSPEADPAVDAAASWAVDQGVVVVAPAGNGGRRGADHPAALVAPPGILGVAASGPEDELALLSSFGVGVDLMAPGTGIHGPGVNTAFEATATPGRVAGQPSDDGRCPFIADGTSLAAAYVAGAAALLLAFDPGLTPAQVASLLVSGCDRKPVPIPGRPRYGRLNATGAIRILQSFTPTPPYYTPTPTHTPTISDTPTVTNTPTVTESPTPTPSFTHSATGTLTPPDTATPTRTPYPRRSPTPTPNPKDASLTVFPDPARGKYVTFRFKVPNVSELSLEVYDRYGAPVTFFEKTGEGWVDFVLALKGMPDGIYTYHATARNSVNGRVVNIRNRKFVVLADDR
jgi:hypothetical protein